VSDTAQQPPTGAFERRHIGPDPAEQQQMLTALGYRSLDALIDEAVPSQIRTDRPLALPAARNEAEVLSALRDLAAQNDTRVQMIGLGYYDTITPAVLRRNMLESPAWYTAYTPYQPEISQGRLEALLTFQTLIEELTALPIASASLLDEATAVVEAVLLMRRSIPRGINNNRVLVDRDLLPQTLTVLRGRANAIGIEVVETNLAADIGVELAKGGVFGTVLQCPGASGLVSDYASIIAQAHDHGALATVAADPLSLTLMSPPGELGADIAVGSAQRFGVPLFFGGPHAGYMAVRSGLERMLPGRLVGVSVDASGQPAYRLALQTREQHIRREKATSNICTAQALLANVAAMYAVYHGPDGLRAIATRVHNHARHLAESLHAAGIAVVNDHFFDTITVRAPGQAREFTDEAERAGINLRLIDSNHIGIACDETTSVDIVNRVLSVFKANPVAARRVRIPATLVRTSQFLEQPVFRAHRSETAMLRFLRGLSDKDLALDRTMIPLGSCTMKLNSAVEMEPISWPEFASIHPFAPSSQTAGYRQLINDLERWLCEITGYDRVSLQPNAGSQGELAGLLAIKGYHDAHGDHQRTVCLIPQSAHGTNAASAVLAGMQVQVVATARDGGIDLDDLRAKLFNNVDTVAAIMLTYPSTHGVYEQQVGTVCELVHYAGGQVYIDGANMNALVGLAKPGHFGGDVSHLNLHKTFCIPHGGGGPGVGPVAVRAHLAPYLPGDPLNPEQSTQPAIAAAPQGSAGILPITWAYLALMGPEGLANATRTAVLSANYIAKSLSEHYPVLYTGPTGLVAHECIIDLRELTRQTGVTAEDVAKRLIDYGFHAPTLSFPVNGTLMVEPTESENLAELGRFIDAMIAIRREISDVAAGTWPVEHSPLRNAPHTAEQIASDSWDFPYSRAQAVYPLSRLGYHKYWPPVRRIDGVHGDRNLVCSCPPPEAFATTLQEINA